MINSLKVAMEDFDLENAFTPKLEFHDKLKTIVVYLTDGQRETVIIAFDLIQLSVPFCNEVRYKLAQKCKIDTESIITHCTHTHAAPTENQIREEGTEKLIDSIGVCIEKCRKSAEPAHIRFAEIDTDNKFNVNRRKKIDLADASFTVWYAYNDWQGQPDGHWQIKRRLELLTGREISERELPYPIIYDRETDGLIQAIQFLNSDGKVIGTIVRYSAHPCGAVHAIPRKYSADFPAIVRETISKHFGGKTCFLTGPCGNIAPWCKGKWDKSTLLKSEEISLSPIWVPHTSANQCYSEINRIGQEIANNIIPSLEKANVNPTDDIKLKTIELNLPIRSDLLSDPEEADQLSEEYYQKFLKSRNELPIPELRKLADKRNFLKLHKPFYSEYYYLTPEQWKQKTVTIDLPTIKLGDIFLLGLPGEVFWETQLAAKEHAEKNNHKLFCFTEANGDIGYIPTKEEFPLGDYEANCSILAPEAEEKIAQSAKELIESLIG